MPRQDTNVLHRRTEVARRYLQGEMQSQIAASFGVSQGLISQDLKVIRAAWLASAIRDFDTARAEELAKLDAVEREYWAAWEKSKQDEEVSTQEQYDDPLVTTEKNEKGELVTVIKTKTRKRLRLQRKGQAGGAVYLEGILKCISKRCDILGLDAPKRFTINWDELTPEQEDELARGVPPEKVLGKALSA